MFCAGFHDINSCRLDAGMTEQVRQFRDIFFEVVKCPRKQEIENILKTAGFILFFLKKVLKPSRFFDIRIVEEKTMLIAGKQGITAPFLQIHICS